MFKAIKVTIIGAIVGLGVTTACWSIGLQTKFKTLWFFTTWTGIGSIALNEVLRQDKVDQTTLRALGRLEERYSQIEGEQALNLLVLIRELTAEVENGKR